MKKANITDITLKTLAQDREVSLLFREKTAIAVCADSLGVNAVELAPIKNLREDYPAVRFIGMEAASPADRSAHFHRADGVHLSCKGRKDDCQDR